MTRLPTDLQILNAIYERYYSSFAEYTNENNTRSAKIYIPLDIGQLAKDLKVDGDIIFGRLYYHLDKKYGYRHEDNCNVHFFALSIGDDRHCINFPLMASVLADLRDQAKRHTISRWIAVGAVIISIVSVVISLATQDSW